MAWEEFDRRGNKGFSGDAPIDEFATALKHIGAAYEGRFSRKPTIAELLHALETVIGAAPKKYVSDPEGLETAHFGVERAAAPKKKKKAVAEPVDVAAYEGAYTDVTTPGYYLVQTRAAKKKPATIVLKVPTLAISGRTLRCEYEILVPTIDDDGARLLLRSALLAGFCDHAYAEEADEIAFHDLAAKKTKREPY